MVEVHKGVIRPESLAQFFLAHQFPWPFKQGCEHLKGLLLEFDSQSGLAQFTSRKVQLKHPKTNDLHGVTGSCH
jgi:hypothetical protein